MAFLCHEIRNPLFAITSMIALLEDEDLSTDQERALSSIGQSTNLMLRLVNDVLDISKLDSGKLMLEDRDFALRDMLLNVAHSTHRQIEQNKKPIQFEFSMDSSVPSVVCGDSVRILQIAYNLLSNAAKFTDSGLIHFKVSVVDYNDAVQRGHLIGLSLVSDDDSNGNTAKTYSNDEGSTDFVMTGLLESAEEGCGTFAHTGVPCALRLEVTDSGCGIAPDRIATIFQPYAQNKLSDYRKYGGTGLGLAILSKLCLKMGGSINVDSDEGEGATFVVYLPLRVSDASPWDAERPQKLTESGSAKLPVLVHSVSDGDLFFTSSGHSKNTNLAPPKDFSNSESTHLSSRESNSLLQRQPCATKKSNSIRKFAFPTNDNVVLIVDDNNMNRKLLGSMLTYFNAEYVLACDGQEAVNIILQSRNRTGNPNAPHFSLIFMDLSMPVMDGCEAIRVIREEGLTLPIVALTACAVDMTRTEAEQAGATEFVTKPILRCDLYEKCRHYLEGHHLV
jgi:signal transduction histidine kinase/ActR/RegA family two-component response regulator